MMISIITYYDDLARCLLFLFLLIFSFLGLIWIDIIYQYTYNNTPLLLYVSKGIGRGHRVSPAGLLIEQVLGGYSLS